jgi:hypothetical protein
MPCNYTDPAMRPISVTRALTCPDGTLVWVQGVVMIGDDERWLCDEAHTASLDACADAGVLLVGDLRSVDGGYMGELTGRHLELTARIVSSPTP